MSGLAVISVRFDEPRWLLLLLLLVPVVLIAWRARGSLSRARLVTAAILRAIVITALTLSLARPFLVREGEGLTVTVVLDRSQSVPLALRRSAAGALREATAERPRPEDRLALITVGRTAEIAALPDVHSQVEVAAEPADTLATNLEEGISLAMAIMPNDTANRILLVSDGNETMGSIRTAGDLARANGVPVDVAILSYDYDREVLVEQLVAPVRARIGQTIRLRAVLRSIAPATGRIRFEMNDVEIDLGDGPGGMAVELDAGVSVFERQFTMNARGPQRFRVRFEPDDPAFDVIPQNNVGDAVTFVAGEGRILVMADSALQTQFLAAALRSGNIVVDIMAPDQWRQGILALSGYDAVVLANVPRYAFDAEQDRALYAYVHDLGGGLVMLGGDTSFGAGGWIDSQTARALPVELNPPATRQLPSGALALIMHSCEMPQGNYWGQQVARAAIEALSRLDYVGIVEFNWNNPGDMLQGASWAFPMQQVGDKQAALRATQTMTVGDMPSFMPSMQLALDGLMRAPAAQRHAIIISDGDPSPPSEELLRAYVTNRVTVTTVMVGGHGTAMDRSRMEAVADVTGGTFYDVKNPNDLPQIFIKEAQIVSRSLIQDGDTWTPAVVSSLPGPTAGFSSVPPIDGYVLTVQRRGLAQTPIVIPTSEAQDPLFAHWNFGVGRAIAWTSDATRLWGAAWLAWPRFETFWQQAIRWVMRPSGRTNVEVVTRIAGDDAYVEVQAVGEDAAPLNFLRSTAVVVRPDASVETLPLQQVGPGRYLGRFRTREAGAYLVNVLHESGAGDAREAGTVQAAVSVSYPPEFRTIRHNAAALIDLAERTGGRIIDLEIPRQAGIFDAVLLALPRIPRPVWDLVAIIAAGLLLLDVAVRRLAIEPGAVASLLRRLTGRRGEQTTGTLSAWKRAKDVTEARVRAPSREEAAIRFEATEEERRQVRPVETTAGPAVVPDATRRGAGDRAPAPGASPPADDEGHTSRLLAAKRRARGEGGDGGT
ncbi:MAG: hypothetical protein KF817_01480 [Phycisphaeraceae bacterium]|nr:hypothetical protein [Phycisphaeraceae bacterium]